MLQNQHGRLSYNARKARTLRFREHTSLTTLAFLAESKNSDESINRKVEYLDKLLTYFFGIILDVIQRKKLLSSKFDSSSDSDNSFDFVTFELLPFDSTSESCRKFFRSPLLKAFIDAGLVEFPKLQNLPIALQIEKNQPHKLFLNLLMSKTKLSAVPFRYDKSISADDIEKQFKKAVSVLVEQLKSQAFSALRQTCNEFWDFFSEVRAIIQRLKSDESLRRKVFKHYNFNFQNFEYCFQLIHAEQPKPVTSSFDELPDLSDLLGRAIFDNSTIRRIFEDDPQKAERLIECSFDRDLKTAELCIKLIDKNRYHEICDKIEFELETLLEKLEKLENSELLNQLRKQFASELESLAKNSTDVPTDKEREQKKKQLIKQIAQAVLITIASLITYFAISLIVLKICDKPRTLKNLIIGPIVYKDCIIKYAMKTRRKYGLLLIILPILTWVAIIMTIVVWLWTAHEFYSYLKDKKSVKLANQLKRAIEEWKRQHGIS